VITLESPDSSAVVAVSALHGGRVAQITIDDTPILKGHAGDHPMSWGSFPMVPWAGRIRHGRFSFSGETVQLPVNLAPHAIHGTVFTHPWIIDDAGRDYCELSTRLDGWFSGTVTQHLVVDELGLTCVLSLMADADMPATIGWHPCFLKPFTDEVAFRTMLPRDGEGIPTGLAVAPTRRPWDDCFRDPVSPLLLRYRGFDVTLTSDCEWWVVYDEPDDVICIEPQSAPPDAVNLGLADVLRAGDLLQRTFRIGWQRSATGW
jgi:aldose 1-epimerase